MDKQLKLTLNGNTCNRRGQLRNFEFRGNLYVHKVKCSYDVPVSNPVTKKVFIFVIVLTSRWELFLATGFETGMPFLNVNLT